ncbi:COX1 assembly protein-like protein Shy1 [Rhexocercosporidium sp. MPI-PUGE-AT-0058]|nr:COX1 assembly protein-like protein Shy1 [Rhexocercosporidium sp. MPI-PUGE-AT-0058]
MHFSRHCRTSLHNEHIKMKASSSFLRQSRGLKSSSSNITRTLRPAIFQRCPACRHISSTPRAKAQPADNPDFMSIVDNPPNLVRSGKRHGPGLIILALIPITAFALGTWQVQRLDWKSKLIAKFEDRLVRDPLPLPQQDIRHGIFRHDQEMLIGPRMHDGTDGYLVITPLERRGRGYGAGESRMDLEEIEEAGEAAGWVAEGVVTVEGLLREPWKKNMFTPENRPEKGKSDLLKSWDREARGIPIGRPAEVNLRNNHTQYIFTWYALAAATSVMLWMVVKKPPQDIARRVRQNKEWS